MSDSPRLVGGAVPAKRPESVLVVIHAPGGNVLLLRRVDQPGFWQSVTGSLQAHETPLAAARREIVEETGFSGNHLEDCGRVRRFAITGPWRARYAAGVGDNIEHEFRLYLEWPAAPRLSPREHDRARWCPRPEALSLATSWSNRAAIRMLPVVPAQATIVLVHGLWMGSPSMGLLALRLRRAGFRVRLFHYFSTRESPPAAARRLARLTARLDSSVVHFVAHSLGGIVLAHLFARGVSTRTGRVALLGSPMQDSAAARGLHRLGFDWALGAARADGLLGENPPWRTEVPVATIAGDRPFGLGRIVANMAEPHDGAVAVRETIIPGASRVVRPVTHTGLLASRDVACRVITWLRDGWLPGDAPVAELAPAEPDGERG